MYLSSNNSKTINKKTFNNLQIFRGIAAIMVLLGHANLIIDKELFNAGFSVGWCGVDFFFILSGFLILYTTYNKIGKRDFIGDYFKKRFVRVYPIYWIYTTIVVVLHIVSVAVLHKKIITDIVVDTLGLIKSYTLYPTDIRAGEYPILPVAWTLSYEILFYTVLGICILLKKRWLVVISSAWILLILFFNIYFPNKISSSFLYTISNTHNIEFLLGCVIAYLIKETNFKLSRVTATAILVVGIIFLVISWINEVKNHAFYRKMDFVNFGIPFSLIIIASIFTENSGTTNKAKKLLIFLGDASYSIYLVHYVLIILLQFVFAKVLHTSSLSAFISISIFAIFSGCIAYVFIEKPLIKFLNSKTQSLRRSGVQSVS